MRASKTALKETIAKVCNIVFIQIINIFTIATASSCAHDFVGCHKTLPITVTHQLPFISITTLFTHTWLLYYPLPIYGLLYDIFLFELQWNL